MNQIEQYLEKHPGYVNQSPAFIKEKTGGNLHDIRLALRKMRNIIHPKTTISVNKTNKNESLDNKVKALLIKRKNDITLDSIADVLDVSPKRIKSSLDSLRESGHNVQITEAGASLTSPIPKSDDFYMVDVTKDSKNLYEFGVCGDNHLCSRYERLDVLNALYDIYEKEGIKKVLNTGNWIDGEARFNKNDLNVHGMDRQIDYMIKNYPKRKGIITYFISGDDHEGWWNQSQGIDIGKYLELKAKEQGRNDLIYLGHMEADVVLPTKNGETRIRVCHPGGGSSYAVSYTSQKIVESYTGGEKPNILLLGHYHKAEYSYVRGVHVVQSATTMEQSPFMRKKRLAAHLGGWTIKFSTDDNGAVTRFAQEFFPFYDKPYYDKPWSYKN